MTAPKHSKRVKPDPELLKLADALLANYQKPEGYYHQVIPFAISSTTCRKASPYFASLA